MGLKPLKVEGKGEETTNVSADGNRIYRDKKTEEVFEHVPAKSLTALKEETKLRERLDEQREKRKLVDKIR